MTTILLDTNAYTAFKQGRAEALTIVQRASTIAMSSIVLGELQAGFAVGSREARKDATSQYIGLANVQSNTGEIVTANDEVGGQCFRYQADDILFARLRPYLNKVHWAENGGLCSPEFHVIRIRTAVTPDKEVLPGYLATILRSSLILAQTKHMMIGNTHPRLVNEDVVNLVVPLPELPIQKRVVDEVKRRRTEVRRLRHEAEVWWAAAKARFERRLLGEEE